MKETKDTKTLEGSILESKILNPLYIMKFSGVYLLGQTALQYFAEKGEIPHVAFNAAMMGAIAMATYSEIRNYVGRRGAKK